MNNELKHYGVLGMKWGRHKLKQYAKAAKRANKYYTNKMNEVGSLKNKTSLHETQINEYRNKAHDSKHFVDHIKKNARQKVSDKQLEASIANGKKYIDDYLKLENGDKNFYKKYQEATKKELFKAFPMLNNKHTEFEYDEYGRVTNARRKL